MPRGSDETGQVQAAAKTDDVTLNGASDAPRRAMLLSYEFQRFRVMMVVGGILTVVCPLFSSVALVHFLGWVMMYFGVIQLTGLIGTNNVPQFWLQLISVERPIPSGFLFVRNPAAGRQLQVASPDARRPHPTSRFSSAMSRPAFFAHHST